MTGRTHDLAALTTLVIYLATQPLPSLSLGTACVSVVANMIGGIAPDLDQPTAGFWRNLPAGSIIGRIVCPLLGAHRMISHSLAGMVGICFVVKLLLNYAHHFLLVDVNLVWWAFVFGYASHLIMDTITKEGVPWLLPLPIRLGIPPFKFMRITTGGIVEKLLIYPGLLLADGALIYLNYHKFIDLITHRIVR